MSDHDPTDVGDLLSLVVHDLRNPVATISANVAYIRDVARMDDSSAYEALDDVEQALGDLARGLEQLSWIGRWMGGRASQRVPDEDVREAVRRGVELAGGAARVELPPSPVGLPAGGDALTKLVELLVRNARSHGAPSSAEVELVTDREGVRLRVLDDGQAVAEELRERIFSPRGQQEAKGRSDGRYSRAVGLLAARAIADSLGATLTAEGVDGAAAFVVRFQPADRQLTRR